MIDAIPKPIVIDGVVVGMAAGRRHKINSYAGYYVQLSVSVDLHSGLSADVQIELRENTGNTVLHRRDVTVSASKWTPIELQGIINRIEDVAEIQVVASQVMTGMNYRIVATRHQQQGA